MAIYAADVKNNKLKHIPVGVLVDPAVKQASTHGYNNHDFELFGVISRHARLTVDQAMPMADLLGKISLNDPLFGRCAAGPLETILRRFGDKSRAHEYVERFSKVALATFMHVESKHGGQMRQLRDKQRADIATAKARGDNVDIAENLSLEKNGAFDILMIRQALIVSMLQMIVNIENNIYNVRLRPLLEKVNQQFANLNDGRHSKGLTALINLMDTGDVMGDQRDLHVFEFAEYDEEADEDNGNFAPETRRKRNANDGDREMMRAAQQGKILVFSDDEDTENARQPYDSDDEENYFEKLKRGAESASGSDEESDNFVATGSGGKRQFKRGAALPTVNTSDLLDGLVGESTSPQRPRRPKGERQPQPSPRTKRVKKNKKNRQRRIAPKNNSDHKIQEYERGKKKQLRDKKHAEWLVGKRKVHMKIKKAPKTVQGDIDSFKLKHELRLREAHREETQKRYRENQVRRRMRKQFERKLAAKQMHRRRQQEIAKRGVKTIKLFGRLDRGDRHAGNFYERQDAMLQMHLNAKGETQKAIDAAQEWIKQSLSLFKNWLKPLRYIFAIYTSEFVNAFSPAFDFQALMERSGGLALGEYMKFCRDFKLVPKILGRTESLALYHYANAEDGNRTARHNEPLLGFEELISCLHGVAMSEAFNSLPDVTEKVDALCGFMRRVAIQEGLSGPGGSINRVMHRRMGNKRQWENGRCPMIEYQWIVPRTLGMPESLMYSLEILDECLDAAANVHILDLVKVEWNETIEPEEEEWEPPNTVPLQSDRLYPSDQINANKMKVHPAAGSHVYGFGGGFVPPPKPKRMKRRKDRRFGERTISGLPLRFVPAARFMITLLKELADDCVSGQARKRLILRYNISGKGWEAVTEAPLRQGQYDNDGNYVKMGPRKVQVPPEPQFVSPKKKEKAAIRQMRQAQKDKKINELKEKKRRERALELELILEAQSERKAARDAKNQEEKEKIKKKKQMEDMRRRREMAELTRKQREEIEQWKANGGKRGGGKKGVYKNYMSTSSRDASEYAEEKRKKMAAFRKKKEDEKAKAKGDAELKRKKKELSEASRQRSVKAQRRKQQLKDEKEKEDKTRRQLIEEDDVEAQTKAALKIEAVARGKRDRAKVKGMMEQKKKEKAACKIEARVRGNRDRARVAKLREERRKAQEKSEGDKGAESNEEDTDHSDDNGNNESSSAGESSQNSGQE